MSFISNIPEYTGIGVYALVNNRNKKMYIGASQNIRRRIIQHKSNCPSALNEDIKNGDTFSVRILEKLPYGSNQFDMFGRESHYIQLYETLTKGYNRAKTTCSTKEELLESLNHFKNNSDMKEYIKNIIDKRERPIYPDAQHKNISRYYPINLELHTLIQSHIQKTRESVIAFITRAIDETMERDNKK